MRAAPPTFFVRQEQCLLAEFREDFFHGLEAGFELLLDRGVVPDEDVAYRRFDSGRGCLPIEPSAGSASRRNHRSVEDPIPVSLRVSIARTTTFALAAK